MSDVVTSSLTILATLLSPFIAVQATQWISKKKEERERKISVFKRLMISRGYDLSLAHIEALNSIDLEFHGSKNYQHVIEHWNLYLDHLKSPITNPEQWMDKKMDLFTDLLYEMGKSLDYNFDKLRIKKSIYEPNLHRQINKENEEIRKSLLSILDGHGAIPVRITNP